MNIAVVITKEINEGGVFQYAVSMCRLLEKHRSSKYNFVYFTILKKNIAVLKKYGLSSIYLPWSNLDRCGSFLLNSQLIANIFTRIKVKLETKLDRIFKKYKIDLVYFLSPADLALALNRYNYIFTVWELCFLDSMEFPEVYINKEFERRQQLYQAAIIKAIAVISESEFTKKNIINRYGADDNRIIVLPFLPSSAVIISEEEYGRNFLDIKLKYNISGEYIFYPAQFWAHKNHVYILAGLKLLKEKYKIKIQAVFSGSDRGNLSFVLKKAEEFKIADQICYIGFVDDRELPYLYKQALALVMPTYFGPTNIPPLEAFANDCPVLYSDLPGMRQQVEGAAILLDLDNPESLCRGLIRMLEDVSEKNAMIKNARRKIELLMKEDHWAKLRSIFDDYEKKTQCWK